jgi:hypothetical protein
VVLEVRVDDDGHRHEHDLHARQPATGLVHVADDVLLPPGGKAHVHGSRRELLRLEQHDVHLGAVGIR